MLTSHTLIQAFPDPVWLTDPTGSLLDCNRPFLQLLGLPEATSFDQAAAAFAGSALAELRREVAAQANGPAHTAEAWLTDADDGEHRRLQITWTPLYDPDGSPVEVLGLARDITTLRHPQAEWPGHGEPEQPLSLVEQLGAQVAERTADLEAANRRLAQSAERLALATSSAGMGVWESDLVNNKLFWDEQMCALYGITPEEFAGTPETWDERIHPDDREHMEAEIVETLRGERDYDTTFRVVWPDGSIHYLAAQAKLERDTSGTPRRVVGVNWEITARALAEQEIDRYRSHLEQLVTELEASNRRLRMSDQRLQALFDLSQQATSISERALLQLGIQEAVRLTDSTAGYLHLANTDEGTIELVIWSGSDRMSSTLEGDTCDPLVWHGLWADVMHTHQPVIHNDGPHPGKQGDGAEGMSAARRLGVPVIEGDSVRLLLGVSNKPTDYDHADVRELQLIGDDLWRIVMRQRAERALRASEARYRTLFESSVDALVLVDADTLQIVDGNQAALTLFAVGARDHLLTLGLDQLAPESQPSGQPSASLVRVHSQRALSAGGAVFQWTAHTVDGTRFPVLMSLSALPNQERPQLLVITRDISAMTQYQADLERARDAAEAANRAKSSFLANMSHELRTPLNAILGRAELLREQIYGPLTEPQYRALSSIEEGGIHLLELINDVLDLAKVEADQLQLTHTEVEVNEICHAALRLVAQSAAAKRIVFSQSSDNLDLLIRADGRRLKQILVNLLANAIKFTPDEGQIGLEVRTDAVQQTVSFTVWDSGIGITAEDLSRLFQPFVQIDNRLSRQYDGTGLGLALVRRLAELHGGRVSVESRTGVGSRFCVTLPWEPLVATERPRPGPAVPSIETALPADVSPPLVLVAEDNTTNVQLLCDSLPLVGYHVIVAGNGETAVRLATQLQPAIILMDIQLLQIDGLEATRRIRAAGLRDTPIIALTALAMPGDRERCLAAGADAYLAKPVRMRNLLATIATQLQRRNPL